MKIYSSAPALIRGTVSGNGFYHTVKVHTTALLADGSAFVIPVFGITPLVFATTLRDAVALYYKQDTTIGPFNYFLPRSATRNEVGIAPGAPARQGALTDGSPTTKTSSQFTLTLSIVGGGNGKFVLLDSPLGNTVPFKRHGLTGVDPTTYALAIALLAGNAVSFDNRPFNTLVSNSLKYNRRLERRYRL